MASGTGQVARFADADFYSTKVEKYLSIERDIAEGELCFIL
jgi:hypothetical protein